jgi:hypothetical protein
MADNNFRSYRSHDPQQRDEANPRSGSDPLAELARLIGRSEHYAESGRHDTAPAPLDWAAQETYAAQDQHPDQRYAQPPIAPHQSYEPQDQGYANEAPHGDRYFSGSAAQFNGFSEEAYDQNPPHHAARQLPAYATAAPHDDYEAGEPGGHPDEAYPADDYHDEAPRPRRRGGLVIVMAIFGLAVLGSAGAFGYRAMFGGSVLPTLPPIIKAGNGPNKIVPNSADSQADSSAGAATTGSTEKLVSREEQPVTMEPPKPAPRVVSTIPIITGQGSIPPGGAPAAPAPTPAFAAAPTTNWPPPPPPSAGMAAPSPPPAPMPAAAPPPQVSSEPKRIHTVTIRGDQSGGSAAATAPLSPAPTPARPSTRSGSTASKPSTTASVTTGSNAPLSIVPGGQPAAPQPARARVAVQPAASPPMAVASAEPAAADAASAPSGSGYSVQVTSQRSEAEAQAAFRSLRAKYPDQLNGRQPIIRRADLGAKGIYYRALVGPFASADEAAGLCRGLKAAGGTCIVQRN